jgi:hypothetical protein
MDLLPFYLQVSHGRGDNCSLLETVSLQGALSDKLFTFSLQKLYWLQLHRYASQPKVLHNECNL